MFQVYGHRSGKRAHAISMVKRLVAHGGEVLLYVASKNEIENTKREFTQDELTKIKIQEA